MTNSMNVASIISQPQQPQRKRQNNVYQMPSSSNDQFVRQQPAISQDDMLVQMLQEQKKKEKKQNIKQNIAWGVGIASGLAIIAMVAMGLRGGKDASKAKELAEKVKNIKNEVIKREVEEELARQPHERSVYRAADLIKLDELASTSETRTVADIGALKAKLDRKIIGQDKAKQPVIDFLEAINYDIKNGIYDGKPVIIAIDGPPGTSKTTLLKEAADGLGMYFKKVPLCSIEKAGSLVGFQRTYVGAKGGTFATAQLEGNTKRVFYALDELEKAPTEVRQTLLPLLDDQAKFKDLYYNTEIDLSQSIFGITTNELERLKGTPLYDRIKPFVIKVEKYDNATKAGISKLKLTDALKENKMDGKVIVDEGIYDFIAEHTTDAGGRETTQISEKKIITELKKILNYKSEGEKVTVDKDFVQKLLTS